MAGKPLDSIKLFARQIRVSEALPFKRQKGNLPAANTPTSLINKTLANTSAILQKPTRKLTNLPQLLCNVSRSHRHARVRLANLHQYKERTQQLVIGIPARCPTNKSYRHERCHIQCRRTEHNRETTTAFPACETLR
jgi:hypothetical protein